MAARLAGLCLVLAGDAGLGRGLAAGAWFGKGQPDDKSEMYLDISPMAKSIPCSALPEGQGP